MKEQIKIYETPEVELVEVYVEKGFNNSHGTDAEDNTGTGGENDDDL